MKHRFLLNEKDYEEFMDREFRGECKFPILAEKVDRMFRCCAYCGDKNTSVKDHVIPKSRGGSNSKSNLVWSCWRCNSKKGAKTPDEAGMPIIYAKESKVR